MLPLSVHLVAWPHTRAGLAAASQLGFGSVEVFALGLWNNHPSDISGWLAEYGLSLSAVFLDLPADPAAAEAAAARAAADARTFGARRLVVTASHGDVHAAVAAAGSAAARAGVRLCLHPHQGTAVESAADTDAVLAATDPAEVWVCADTGHLLAAGDDPAAAIAAWLSRLAAVHVKDIDAAGRIVPVGTGRLDLPATVGALRRATAAGAPLEHLTIEVEDLEDTEAGLRHSVRAVTAVAA